MNKTGAELAAGEKLPTLSDNLDNDEIHSRIFEAIVDHRLQPGTHLKEDVLSEIYKVGRTRIRVILSKLAADQVVELVTNRGAFVSRPTVKEAREVFRARRLIEGHLVRRATEKPDEKFSRVLYDHLRQEKTARETSDQATLIKRCHDYHQVLADHAESPIMARFLRELIARSSLIVAIYGTPPKICEIDEHRTLTEHVLEGRADEAVALMELHLSGIEDRLNLQTRKGVDEDLRRALTGS